MDDRQYNIHFVKCIERHPCLWNYMLPQYTQRDVTEKAWEEISRDMKETVSNCRERWKNIRNGLSRSLKLPTRGSGPKQKKQYYLFKHLQFLIPYLRKSGNWKTKNIPPHNENNQMENTTENSLHPENEPEELFVPNTDFVENSCTHEEIKEEKISEECTMQTTDLLQKLDDEEKIKPKKRKIKREEHCNEVDSALIALINSTKEKKDPNANSYFLKSLLPYMEEMTAKQNRRFRQKVVKLIDDILDDKDVEGMQSSSSSTLMEYGAPSFVLLPQNN